MNTRATGFNDTDVSEATVFVGLASEFVWNDGALGYHLQFSDADRDNVNDWDEDGARAAIEGTFGAWAAVADLTFTETSLADANLIERIGDADGNLGVHFLPGGNSDSSRYELGRQSDGDFNKDGFGWTADGLQQGGYGFVTLLHEIGHALGLEHPFDADVFGGAAGPYTRGAFDLNQGVYTTMAYTDGWDLRGGSDSLAYGWQGTPMALDIAAVQAIYGANETAARGDDVYALSDGDGAGTFYEAIWDTGGTDELAYAGARDARLFLGQATIDDSATGGGLISYVEGVEGGYTIARGAVIENARSGAGDDLLAGNDAANVLSGGAGADSLFGMDGDDVLMGGAGGDLLVGDYVPVEAFGGSAPRTEAGVSLPTGLREGDGAVASGRTSANGSRGTAIDLSGEFRLGADATDILGGEQAYSVAVSGTGGGGLDYFRLSLNERALVVADIDGASSSGAGDFDSVLVLQDGNGNMIGLNDDSAVTQGGTGSLYGYGANATLDSYLAVTLDPGTYYLVVGQYAENEAGYDAIASGGTYDLNVSADARVPDSLPADALGQLAYYYEQPDYGDLAQAAFGGGAGPGTGARAEIGKDHDHDHGRGHDQGHGQDHGHGHADHAGGHGEGCGCGGCQGVEDEAGDAGFETRLFAFDAELGAFSADADLSIG